MNGIRIGGWTRLWLAISAASLVAASFGWRDESRYAREKADEQYKSDIAYHQACVEERDAGAPRSDSAFDNWIFRDCVSAPDKKVDLASLEKAAQQRRESAISGGEAAALSYALNLFLWPAMGLGVLFAAIGWIRAGFRRQAAR